MCLSLPSVCCLILGTFNLAPSPKPPPPFVSVVSFSVFVVVDEVVSVDVEDDKALVAVAAAAAKGEAPVAVVVLPNAGTEGFVLSTVAAVVEVVDDVAGDVDLKAPKPKLLLNPPKVG